MTRSKRCSIDLPHFSDVRHRPVVHLWRGVRSGVVRLSDEDGALEIIRDAYNKYDPVAVYAGFSGGHDSLVSTHIASKFEHFDGVLHINTGIGIPQTREFVREQCEKNGWKLREYSPEDAKERGMSAKTYDEFVLDEGFPGPAAHIFAYSWLKERPIRVFKRDVKENQNDNIMLITGVRKSESDRRMGNTEPHTKDGSLVWTAPITNWTKKDCTQYMRENDLDRNPAVDKMHMSGECLCGAFAKPNEKEVIRKWYPEVAERIESLEEKCEEEGVWCHWGKRPDEYNPNQLEMQPMCSDCPETRREVGT